MQSLQILKLFSYYSQPILLFTGSPARITSAESRPDNHAAARRKLLRTSHPAGRCYYKPDIDNAESTAEAVLFLLAHIKGVLGNKVYNIASGFLPLGGAAKPQECYVPFKALTRRIAAKRQGKV